MVMLYNWDIGGCVSDFWDYVRQPRPHRWTSWGVASAIAILLFWGFGKYLIPYEKPKPQIIYFENWKADRSEADIRADWIARIRSEEHTSELQSLMRISYAVFCLKKKKKRYTQTICPQTPQQHVATEHHTKTASRDQQE